ncbi:MAG: 30S ribosome-binding factor RbfA [Bacteroidota bacterium]|jgi:ribosome-binding factor A
MKESIRQTKIAGVIQEALNEIFQKLGLNMLDGGMVSISDVSVTPDLLIARVSLSFYNIENPQNALDKMHISLSEIRYQLGNKIKNQVRRVPELEFYKDESLDQAFKIEELLRKIKK